MANTAIQNLAAQFCSRTVAANPATIDDEIKVYVATLAAFNAQGQLRSLVTDETVDGETIGQAQTIVDHLDQLTFEQKQNVLKQLKEMSDAAEKEIMAKLLSASANSDATTISELVDVATGNDEPEADDVSDVAVADDDDDLDLGAPVTAIKVEGLGDVGSLIAKLLGATAAPTVVDGIDLNKVKEIIADRAGVDFAALRRTFNM